MTASRGCFVLIICLFAAFCAAQTATTGAIAGVITDPSGAVVPKADVELLNAATNAAEKQISNASGQFTFPSLQPGIYKVTVKMTGFRTASLTDVTVEVNKTTSSPVQLQVGTASQTVEVTAGTIAQLQTADAQIGNTVSTNAILRLPTLQRNATELMNLQPGVVAGGSNLAMRVSGAIDDQNTVTLDGLDITQQVVAGNTAVPTPADSVEEFRVTVSNAGASSTRASGGQVTLVGRRGGNVFNGALYEYLQNGDLNSNTWDNNRAGLARGAIKDNRFGGRLGGPIRKDKTFFFANYEGRRFANVTGVTRTVPTANLKQGILQFSGSSQQFNLATAAICGPNGNLACDPRGLGISPAVKAQWALMPLPNLSGGDGFNTGSYFFNLPVPVQTDYGVMRLDHTFTDKLTLNASYTYFRSITTGSGDVGIVNGTGQSLVQSPQRGSVYSISTNWTIAPTWLNTFRFGYVRDNNANQATSPTAAAGTLNIPGSGTSAGPIALLIGSGVSSFIDSPIDMDTQRARYQANYNGDFQWQDDMTKTWGKHTFQFGAQINMLPYTHVRADKVVGSLASLVATVDGDQTYLPIQAVNRPLTCSASVTTNCIAATNVTNWDRYYASVLGLVDNVNVLAVRDANLQPLPFGTFIVDHTNEWAPYFYFQDSWRIKSNLTLTLGLSYGWQSAPTEKNNLQTVMIDAASGAPLDAVSFLQNRATAAVAGQIYNPNIGFATVGQAKIPVYNVDYGDVAPRAAFAWTPRLGDGFLGKFVGREKTVVRGGFSMVYDRSNTVQSVEIPMLGIGFDQNIIVQAPACNATGAGGAKCSASTGVGVNPGLASFRIGVDGSLPLPVPSAATSPVIPPPGYTETLSFQVDPKTKVGRSYNFDLSYQRELPGRITMEMAFIGRYSRHLPQAVNLNQAPYMMADPKSGQTFAQAYDTIANALRAGAATSAIPVQPFFENLFPGVAAANKSSAASATAYIVGANSGNFSNANVGTLFFNMANYRRSINLTPFTNDQAAIEFMRTYIGQSNYSAGILSVQKKTKSLTVVANFTYASALDDYLSNQNNAGYYANSLHPGVDYGPSSYDRRRVFNTFAIYDLPFGKGHRLAFSNAVLDKAISGWYLSPIITAWSGLPLQVTESGQAWGGNTSTITVSNYMIPTAPVSTSGLNQGSAGCPTTTLSGSPTSVGSNNTQTLQNPNPTGLNIFSNPCAAYGSFRYIQLSSDTRTGRANPIRGLGVTNMDLSIGKDTKITERISARLTADMFNVFNFHNYNNPSLSYTNPASFGVITSTFTPPNRTNSARWISIGARIDF